MKNIKMSVEELNTIWGALYTTMNDMSKAIRETEDTERKAVFANRYNECKKMIAKIEAAM